VLPRRANFSLHLLKTEALGHNNKAVHRAYVKRALMKIASLEDHE
jgi:hypothetical protein